MGKKYNKDLKKCLKSKFKLIWTAWYHFYKAEKYAKQNYRLFTDAYIGNKRSKMENANFGAAVSSGEGKQA